MIPGELARRPRIDGLLGNFSQTARTGISEPLEAIRAQARAQSSQGTTFQASGASGTASFEAKTEQPVAPDPWPWAIPRQSPQPPKTGLRFDHRHQGRARPLTGP